MQSFIEALVALQAGQIGPEVANLHAVLARLELVQGIPPDEIEVRRLGPGTARAVGRLFALVGMGENRTGAIDARAAAKLNDFLVTRRILAEVSGVVTGQDDEPGQGLTLRVHDVQNLAGDAAAETRTGTRNTYRAIYDPRFYLEARPGVIQRTDAMMLVVRAFRPDGTEAAHSEATPNPDGHVRIDIVVRGEIPRPPVDEGRRRVRGWLENRVGARLPSFKVEVFDRDLGPLTPEQSLGVAATDEHGAFVITYDIGTVEPGDTAPTVADLVLRIMNARGRDAGEFQIVRQPVEDDPSITVELPVPPEELPMGVPARDDEFLRVVVASAAAPAGPSEFDMLMAALRPLLGERTPAAMDEQVSQDISFAARETGQDAGKIADLAQAFRLSLGRMQGASPAVLYALARTLGLRDAPAIAARATEDIAAALKGAVSSLIPDPGVVPGLLAAQLKEQAATATLNDPGAGGTGTLAEMIAPHLPNPSDQVALLNAFADHTGDPPEFWADYTAANPDKPVAAIQMSLQLAGATAANAPLVAAIRDAHPQALSLRALVLEVDAAKITTLMDQSAAPVPDVGPNLDAAAARIQYAAAVAGVLDAAHPTAAVARMAKGWAAENPQTFSAEGASLLERVVLNTDYELGSGSLAELAETQADVLFPGQNNPAVKTLALNDAHRIERLYNISTGPQTLSVLATASGPEQSPFKGAFDIARLSEMAFLSHFKGAPPQTMQALSAVHETASLAAEATASLLMGALHEAQDPAIAATGASRAALNQPAAAGAHPSVKEIPAWAQLFGTDRLAACDECRALNGPAAYLVQILEFLEHRCAPNADQVTPRDVLIGNPDKGVEGIRPDLAHIKLSCENTDTTLPMIDLINEILEACIVFRSPLAVPPNEPSKGITADELAASPEHIQAKAYEVVGGAVFPITLPFDLLASSARPYLESAKSSREEVIRLFGKDLAAPLAAERLGLTDLDWAIITGTLPDGNNPVPALEIPRLFDLVPIVPGPDLAWALRLDPQVPMTAKLFGLTVNELLALVATRFVSGDWPIAERQLLERFPLDVMSFKALRDSGFAAPAPDMQAVLDWLEVPLADLQDWSDRNLARQARTVVADPINANKLEAMNLVHLDGSPLAEADWLRLHQFARLADRSGLLIADLDLALGALGIDGDLDVAALQTLGALVQLSKDLALDIPTSSALFGGLETGGLYDKLFVKSGVARNDLAFAPNSGGVRLPADANAKIADHLDSLASAFDAQKADVVVVAEARGLTDLAMSDVSKIWRELRLARVLGMAPADLVQLQKLLGQLAFTTVASDPAATAAFIARARQAKDTLAEAIAFCAARLAVEDAAAVDAGQKAITAALAALADTSSPVASADEEKRRTVLEALAAPLAVTSELLALLITDDAAPGVRKAMLRSGGVAAIEGLTVGDGDARRPVLEWIRRLAVLTKSFNLKREDFDILGAAAALPDLANLVAPVDPEALMRSWGKVKAYAASKQGRQPVLLALALSAIAGPEDANRPVRVADAIAAARPPRQNEGSAAEAAARVALGADVLTILPLLPLPGSGASPQEDPISTLAELDLRLAVAIRSAVPAAALAVMAAGSTDPKAAEALELLKRATQSRFDPATWFGVSQRLNDPLRQARRDALISWWMHDQRMDTDAEVFSQLLLDPRTNPVVLTSPIANAINTVQSFVHAARLGYWNNAKRPAKLKVDPGQINPEWDLYLHSFRMTQANFEVLASPYLYMQPDLRDDKTPIFREVEGYLRQNDVNADTVTNAYLMYLEKLGEISNLEVCGTFLQEDFEPKEAMRFSSVLHVFGRSRGGTKRSYFYRRLNRYQNFDEWTPWEPIKVDIQAIERDRSTTRVTNKREKPEAGVHLLPVVWRRKLHIFWPSLVRKIETSDEKAGISLSTGQSTSDVPQPYWEVKLCWSRLENGAWTPRQISSDYHDTYVSALEVTEHA